MTPAEVDRCATVAAVIRPAWPIASLKSWFAKWSANHGHRGYVDTLHAVIACYLDPKTTTPARLAEAGPWWHAAPGYEPERKITMGTDVVLCPKCGHVEWQDEVHQCGPRRGSPEAKAAALAAAAEMRGQYERDLAERVAARKAARERAEACAADRKAAR